MNMLNNATVTTNGALDFGYTPFTVNSMIFKVDGTFGGATVAIGYMSNTSPDAVFCPYTDTSLTLTTPNQLTVITGRESSLAVKITGATGTTKIYINLCPVQSSLK